MSAVYSNKFIIQIGDTARLIFQDERASLDSGLPASISLASEIVMTRDNFIALKEVITKLKLS